MKINKVTLIGLGAMGVFFAPKLDARLGKDRFRVLASGERRDRIESSGVTLNGVTHHFRVISPDFEGDPSDLIIMAVKNPGLDQAIEDIRHQVGADTQILCVMNGIDSEEKVAAVYGWEHVLYSYMMFSNSMKDSASNFDPEAGSVRFGEAKNAVLSERVKAIAELFDACGINYVVEPDMIRGLWFKFMCNIGENMTCAMLRAPFGAFRVSEHANALRREAMWEVVRIANRLGIDIGERDIEKQEGTIQKLPFDNKPSTLQDLEKGHETEVEMFAGRVIRLGRELGIPAPVNWVFYHVICAQEEKNAGLF